MERFAGSSSGLEIWRRGQRAGGALGIRAVEEVGDAN